MPKKILCIDFDGVIHWYRKGWKGMGAVTDDPTPGAIKWLDKLLYSNEFEVHIYSSRSKDPEGLTAMMEAISDWAFEHFSEQGVPDPHQAANNLLLSLHFPTEKPKAFLTIDDRAIGFTGDFESLYPEILLQFEAWNKTDRTRGQIAYEAYGDEATWPAGMVPWASLPNSEKDCWEKVALAVLRGVR